MLDQNTITVAAAVVATVKVKVKNEFAKIKFNQGRHIRTNQGRITVKGIVAEEDMKDSQTNRMDFIIAKD